MKILVLPWRNLWRNRRRSLTTAVSIALGLAAVSLFAGYAQSTYNGLGNSAIHAEKIGHLSVTKKGWLTQGKLNPGKYLLSAEEIEKVRNILLDRLPAAQLAPRLSSQGLISNGHSGTLFIADGIAPRDLQVLLGPLRGLSRGLQEDHPAGVSMGQGLADILGLKVGSDASALVSTIHGQANVLNIDVVNTITTGNLATNDKYVLFPLALAQSLMDVGGRAERLTILLRTAPPPDPALSFNDHIRTLYTERPPTEAETTAARALLQREFDAAGLDLEVMTWQELSAFYRQVKGLYDIIFGLLLVVVLALVVMSIANAMSMSVIERTREIGTLRAIGVRRLGVVRLFVMEAGLLVVVGSLLGFMLMVLARHGINAADIHYNPPGNTISVPLYVGIDLGKSALAALALGILSVGAAYFPAKRAAGQAIIESLGHV